MSKSEAGLDSFQAEMRREQVLALQANVPSSLAVGLLVAGLLAWLAAPLDGGAVARGWPVALGLGTALRALLWWRVQARARSNALDDGDLRVCRSSALLGGISWGVVAIALLEPGDVYRQYFSIVLAGVAAGGVTGKAADIVSVRLFLWPYLLPPALLLLAWLQPLHATLAAMWLLFLVFMDTASGRAAGSFRDLVRLRVLDAQRRGELERLHAEQQSLLRLQSKIIDGAPRGTLLDLAVGEALALSDARRAGLVTGKREPEALEAGVTRRVTLPIDGRGADRIALELEFPAEDVRAAEAPERLRTVLQALSQGLLVRRELERRAVVENELAAERQRLDSILSAAEVAAWDLDLDRDLLRTDGRWAAITRAGPELDPAHVPVACALELLHPDDARLWRAGLDSLIQGAADQWQIESRLRASGNAEPVWVADRARVLERDTNGHARRIAGIRVDATARRSEHAQTEALLERLRKLAQQIPGVIYQFQLRPDGSSAFPFASERIQEIYRVSPEQVRDDASIVFGRLHPDDLEEVSASIARSASELSVWRHQYRVRFEDGEVRWLEGRATPERLADGSTLWHGFITDITERKQLELSLQAGERKLRGLFELAPLGIALHDLDTGRFLDANAEFQRCTGYQRAELLALAQRDLVPAAAAAGALAAAREHELREIGRCAPLELVYQRRDGTLCPVLQSALRIREQSGREVVWTIVQDISERKAMEQALTAQARTDRLTGLANRLAILERLDEACRERRDGPVADTFALLLLDFDNFKFVNDTLGHEAGDDLLRQVAARLQVTVRAIDLAAAGHRGGLVGRLGGDEFVAILEGLHGAPAVESATARVLDALAPPYAIGGTEVTSTASIGIVLADRRYATASEMLRDADVAMYEAKRAGRARARVFDVALSDAVERRRRLEADLRGAAQRRELQLVYQPVFDLRRGELASVEALLRWSHPDLGPISPAEFVPIAEDAGLIGAIGHWVLREACRQLAEWRAVGTDCLPVTMAVNVSRQQLARGEGFVREVLDALRDAALEPQALIVEVTEREVMAAETAMRSALRRLRSQGVRVAVDDFGVGVSSLSCLHEFPLSMIKIDRSFVREIESRRELAAVVSSVLLLADRLGLACVAEGIETGSQLAALRALGCGYGQGYLFSAPLLPAALVEFLRGRAHELELGAHHAA
jgi:diguanylate cyclase (GGDEF)-like protein/PAS domain S-box-containing protein